MEYLSTERAMMRMKRKVMIKKKDMMKMEMRKEFLLPPSQIKSMLWVL
jgi:hypothetical protein